MKQKILTFLCAALIVWSCSNEQNVEQQLSSTICFSEEVSIDKIESLNLTFDQVEIQGGSCVKVSSSSLDFQSFEALVAEQQEFTGDQVEIEVTFIDAPQELDYEIPQVSFPSVFDVFSRLLSRINSSK